MGAATQWNGTVAQERRGALLVERQARCCGAPNGLCLLDDRPAFIRIWISADLCEFCSASESFRGGKSVIIMIYTRHAIYLAVQFYF